MANCRMRLMEFKKRPILAIFAKKDIMPGEELRYDYGVPDLPWRKNGELRLVMLKSVRLSFPIFEVERRGQEFFRLVKNYSN